ncbi:MAG: NADH:flavin oxidoreductase [Gammaproteobacteria bacterium]|nr:NADH:flavin oxidoreductase [Gammaproteobacteria bacterium]
MPRDARYDVLFEPLKIGPVTARNRFYQVPHCNGMGFNWPQSHAKMREAKAEGGWAVICTEECVIHPSSDYTPEPQARLWDGYDEQCLGLMVDAVHRHGALAGVQLAHNGVGAQNLYSRMPPLGPSHQASVQNQPTHTRGMTKKDIREFRRWHRNAALRAKHVDTDIIYVYAGHDSTLLMHFLSARRNQRRDEYGGSLENRVRLFREVLEETRDAVGDRCAIAIRMAVDELLGPEGITSAGEGREVIEMLAEMPDLWDVNVSSWENDSQTSRFSDEGFQEQYVGFVKSMTSKPVVGVGRFTSPDAMVSQLNRGILDMIGAARPSIADPFLPLKIEQGREDEIRECIGCNTCVSGQLTFTPMRCTQNPSVGEEWRRGWHPESIAAKGSEDSILVVGAGPAGLEAARALGQRGYPVTLAEAQTEPGGRVSLESSLPGLATWARVRDWRMGRIQQMENVDVYFDNVLQAEDILELDYKHVILATGASWRADGAGVTNWQAIPGASQAHVITPTDIFAGAELDNQVLVFDDDNYYMGALIAERLKLEGHDVTLLTPSPQVSAWTEHTLEQHRIQTRVLNLGIKVITSQNISSIGQDTVETSCIYTEQAGSVAAATVVLVTSRVPQDKIYLELTADPGLLAKSGIKSVNAIGDGLCPSTIAAAVHDGHRVAREMDAPPENPDLPFKREIIQL